MIGFSREYDLTCCESEAAIHGIPASIKLTKARNILLFSLLLDAQEEGAYPKLWSIFHDFTIDADAVKMILAQTEKLIRLSESVESWRDSPYGDVLRIVNLETFALIRNVWLKYDNAKTFERTFIEQFKSAHTRISRKYQNEAEKFTTVAFTRSFGVQGVAASNVSSNYLLQFWKTGIADLQARPNDICNPLFAYSSADVGPKFAVHFSTCPLAVYHLGTAFVDLTPDSVFYQGRFTSDARAADQETVTQNTKRVVECAKLQFNAWCNAFQQLVKTSRNSIIIRFIVANPVSYCYALQNRSDDQVGLPTFSSTWSGTLLYFNGDTDSMLVDNNPSVKYNVIDTASTALDRAGGINFLVAAIPLLKQSPEATIHTETIAPRWSEETNILLDMLGALDLTRGDVTIMCNVFGVAPLSYLTGCSTRGLMQDLPTILDFSGERPSPILHHVVWKIPALGDSKIINVMKVAFQPDDFIKLLMFAYTRMFARQFASIGPVPDDDRITLYTVRGFVAFLAFLKRRIIVNDWDLAMEMFLTSFEMRPDYGYSFIDLQTQMRLMGVYTPTQLHITIDRIFSTLNPELSTQRPSRRVLSLTSPSTCVVLTVPRARLRQIYDTCFKQSVDFDVRFNVQLHYSAFDDVYSSPIPIFGKLEVSEDGKSCDVETDHEGWHGSSDLHVFLSLETDALTRESSKTLFVSFNMVTTMGCTALFGDVYGPKLTIFKTSLLGDNVHLVQSVNGHHIHIAENISQPRDQSITVDGRYTQTHPKLYMKDGMPWFSTVITLLNEEDRAVLASGAKVAAGEQIQATPCVVFIKYSNVQHICQFPFPISGRASITKISKPNGYIQFSAPLSIGAQKPSGGYSTHFLPLSREIGTDVLSTWNLPTINFSRLPWINNTAMPLWLTTLSAPPQMLLAHMFSDNDHGKSQLRSTVTALYNFKRTLYEFFSHIFGIDHARHRIFALRHGKGEIVLMFFLMGLYINPASNSLVADTYLAQMTPQLAEKYNFKGQTSFKEDVTIVEVNTEELESIRNALPAMVERCRSWEHSSECEYLTELSPKTADGRSHTCSCGMGKVDAAFEKHTEWMEYKPFVIRCAVSPLFPAPYVEQTRYAMLGKGMEALDQIPPSTSDATVSPFDDYDLGDQKVCEVCGKNGNAKKCVACLNVFYCSKECQKKDWKKHKGVCAVRARARAG
jgi:hypothetical protein